MTDDSLSTYKDQYNRSDVDYAIAVIENHAIIWVNRYFMDLFETTKKNCIGYRISKFQPEGIRKIQHQYYRNRLDKKNGRNAPEKYKSFGLTSSGEIIPTNVEILLTDTKTTRIVGKISKRNDDTTLDVDLMSNLSTVSHKRDLNRFILHKLNNTLLPAKLLLDDIKESTEAQNHENIVNISNSVDTSIKILRKLFNYVKTEHNEFSKISVQELFDEFEIKKVNNRSLDDKIADRRVRLDLNIFREINNHLERICEKVFSNDRCIPQKIEVKPGRYSVKHDYVIDEMFQQDADVVEIGINYEGEAINPKLFTENFLYQSEVAIDAFIFVDLIKKNQGVLWMETDRENTNHKLSIMFKLVA